MKEKQLHNNHPEGENSDFFSGGKIVWERSEEYVWAKLQSKMEASQKGKKLSLTVRILRYSAAAVFVLLIGLSAVFYLYSKTIKSLPGEQLIATLPDGSIVELNAESSVKFYPLKWTFNRNVKFNGEGFFKVQKGEKFEVVSDNGITRVLGTSFNVYSRDNQYRVTCITGKVEVVSNENKIVLTPQEHVEIENGKFIMKKDNKAENYVSWKNNQFFFAGRPLKEVFEEIARQYGISIQLHPDLYNRNIAINFPKTPNVEEVLDYVCKPMKIKYVKQSNNVFLIVENS